jgi:hypothetical protein
MPFFNENLSEIQGQTFVRQLFSIMFLNIDPREFEASLAKMTSGDLSLMDSLASVRLAIRAAISDAFKTPDVIKLFAEKQVEQIRT